MKIRLLFIGVTFSTGVAGVTAPPELVSPLIAQKVLATFKSLPSPILYPYRTDSTVGKWISHIPNWWTSGFFPATGYLLNTRQQICNSTLANGPALGNWLALARASTGPLVNLDADHGIGHDVGFIAFPFMEELAINPQNQTAMKAVNRFAQMLAARFNPTVGCIKSWGPTNSTNTTDFRVIIDNMMNLELLFFSADLTGNVNLRQIAISHANATLKNHIRANGSTWHVVDYNPKTGSVTRKYTRQGYSDNSTWSRGQSWAIYSFANMYRRTKIPTYLDAARRVATWLIKNIPADGIVPWDFDAPLVPTLRPADSSAAMITANGLLLLAQEETNSTLRQRWIDNALSILSTTTKLAWKPHWESLLSNGTDNKPANSYSTGIVYGDYYFIKAGNELISMNLMTCPSNAAVQIHQESFAHRSRVPFQSSTRTGSLGYLLLGFLGLGLWFDL